MERNRIRARDVIIVIILIIVSFFAGMATGTITTIKAVVYLATPFIDINTDMVNKAIFQYKNNIAECFYNETKILQISPT